jgi:flagellar motor switch protein FliG
MVFVIFLFFAFTPSTTAYGQATSDTSSIKSADLQVASIEQRYDRQVIEILSNYFDRKKFLVDVNITTEMVEETYTTRQNRVTQSRSPDVVMPGLPYLPDRNRQPNQINENSETIINENTVQNLALKNIIVNIQADSSFTTEELDFMRKIAGIAAKTNTTRGDEVNISQTSIPNFALTQPVATATDSPGSTGFLGSFASLYQYLSVVLVLLLIGLIVYVSRLNRSSGQENIRKRRALFSGDYEGRPDQGSMNISGNGKDTSEHTYESEFDKLMSHFFTKPREVALLFESWAEEEQEEGIINAAKVVSTVDKQLIRSIKSELDDTYYTKIAEAADELPPMTMEQKQEIALDFNETIAANNARSSTGSKRGQIPLFQFLDHISEQELLQLIKDEDPQSSALLLDYLPEQKAAAQLDQLDESYATNVMMKMMQLQELSYKQQKEISSALFEKAIKLSDEHDKNGLDSENIMPILERLPLQEQQRYINMLTSTNPAVGEYLQEHFITADQLPEMDDDLIKEAIASFNTETVLDAAIGFDKNVTEKLLSVRPKREQRLIEVELEQIENADELDTQYAQSLILNAIRQTARKRRN